MAFLYVGYPTKSSILHSLATVLNIKTRMFYTLKSYFAEHLHPRYWSNLSDLKIQQHCRYAPRKSAACNVIGNAIIYKRSKKLFKSTKMIAKQLKNRIDRANNILNTEVFDQIQYGGTAHHKQECRAKHTRTIHL